MKTRSKQKITTLRPLEEVLEVIEKERDGSRFLSEIAEAMPKQAREISRSQMEALGYQVWGGVGIATPNDHSGVGVVYLTDQGTQRRAPFSMLFSLEDQR